MLLALFATTSLCDETIEFAVVIYRHGDRTPVNPYPTDPWKNESLWPVNFGQLTNIGKKRHYQLGQWFRKRYSVSKEFYNNAPNIPTHTTNKMEDCEIFNITDFIYSKIKH